MFFAIGVVAKITGSSVISNDSFLFLCNPVLLFFIIDIIYQLETPDNIVSRYTFDMDF